MIAGTDENEQLLNLLYLCPAALLKFDATGAIEMMTPAGVQLLIPLAATADLSNIFSLFAHTAPELREMIERFAGRAGRVCDEYRVFASVGTKAQIRALALSVTIHKAGEGEFVAIISDVTDAALREEMIRMNEARLRATFDGVRDYSICTVNPAGIITSWNRSAERLDGYQADEVIGSSADVLMAASGLVRQSLFPAYAIARQNGFHTFDSWRIRKDGKRYWASIAVSALRYNSIDEEIIGYSIISRDITEQKRSDDALHHQVVSDALTGVLNRRGLFEAAIREEARLRTDGGCMALLMLDVDHFKHINDTYGHAVGDVVLKQIVSRIRAETRTIDSIGRYGGEEFAILLPGSTSEGAAIVAERIRLSIANSPIPFIGGRVPATVSIGVAQSGAAIHDIANLVRVADAAMYTAKNAGRNRVSVG